MKHFLLAVFIGTSLISFGQNPPVAVNDTLTYPYWEAHVSDSLMIVGVSLISNDMDPNGDSIFIDTVLSATFGQITAIPYQGVVWVMYYIPQTNFWGTDSFQYVLRDNGNPVRYDTATVVIKIQYPAYQSLDANNIFARIDKDVLFSSQPQGPGFEVPAGSNLHSIYAANLWVLGTNNESIYSNIRTFGDSSSFEDKSGNCGPINSLSYQGTENESKWNRVWKVKQYEIDYHVANWNTPNYNSPKSILDWPAHGDTTIGEAFFLAPFDDGNGNGIYEPSLGEFPAIKGDQTIFFIYNDGNSGISTQPMQTEVHGLAYAFQCQDSALQNTIFIDYKIINRSNNTYDSTYFGLWADLDLGEPTDDYVQCDVDRGLYFGLNRNDFDFGKYGYGVYVPAQAVLTLKGAKQDNDGQDNAIGISINQSINGTGFNDDITDNEHWGMQYFAYFNNNSYDPSHENEFYNLLRGYSASGIRWARDFLNTGTPIPYNYVFPGNSDSFAYGTGGITVPGWTESSVGNDQGDRRGVSSSGPVTFAPGDEIELTYAFVFGRDYVNIGAQAGVDNMLKRADSIRSYFNQGMLSACGFPVSVQNPIDIKSEFVVYPNPTNNVVNIRQEKASPITIQILDITGKVLLTTSSKNQLTTVDLSGMVNGVYLVKVTSKNKTTILKIIKN